MDINAIGGSSAANSFSTSKAKASDNSFEKYLENAVNNGDDKQLKKVCKEFEGIFLNMMYKQMRASVPKSELIPGDIGTDMFESMLDEQLMEEAARGKGLGLAEVLYKQLSSQAGLKNEAEESGESLPPEDNK